MMEPPSTTIHSDQKNVEANTVITAGHIGVIGRLPHQLSNISESNKDDSKEKKEKKDWIQTCVNFDTHMKSFIDHLLYSYSLHETLEDNQWEHWMEKKDRIKKTLKNTNSSKYGKAEKLFAKIDEKYSELSPCHDGHLKEHDYKNIKKFCKNIYKKHISTEKNFILGLWRKKTIVWQTTTTAITWKDFEVLRRMFPGGDPKGVIDDIQREFEEERDFSGMNIEKYTENFDENLHVERDIEKSIIEKADDTSMTYHYGIVGTGKSHLARHITRKKNNCIYIDLHKEKEINQCPEISIQTLIKTIIRKCFSSVNLEKYRTARPKSLLKDMLRGEDNLCIILDPIDNYKQVMPQFIAEVRDIVSDGKISFTLFSRSTIHQLIDDMPIHYKGLGCFSESECEDYLTKFFNAKPQEKERNVLTELRKKFTLTQIGNACYNNPKLLSIFAEKIYAKIRDQGYFDEIDYKSLFKNRGDDEIEAAKVKKMLWGCIDNLSKNAKTVLEAISLFPHNDINHDNVVSLLNIEETRESLSDEACSDENNNEDMTSHRRARCTKIIKELEGETLIKRITWGKYSIDPFVREMALSYFDSNPFKFLKMNFIRLQFYHILGKENSDGQGLVESSEAEVRQTVSMLLNNYPKHEAFGILNLNQAERKEIFEEFEDHSKDLIIQYLQTNDLFQCPHEYIYFCQMFSPEKYLHSGQLSKKFNKSNILSMEIEMEKQQRDEEKKVEIRVPQMNKIGLSEFKTLGMEIKTEEQHINESMSKSEEMNIEMEKQLRDKTVVKDQALTIEMEMEEQERDKMIQNVETKMEIEQRDNSKNKIEAQQKFKSIEERKEMKQENEEQQRDEFVKVIVSENMALETEDQGNSKSKGKVKGQGKGEDRSICKSISRSSISRRSKRSSHRSSQSKSRKGAAEIEAKSIDKGMDMKQEKEEQQRDEFEKIIMSENMALETEFVDRSIFKRMSSSRSMRSSRVSTSRQSRRSSRRSSKSNIRNKGAAENVEIDQQQKGTIVNKSEEMKIKIKEQQRDEIVSTSMEVEKERLQRNKIESKHTETKIENEEQQRDEIMEIVYYV